MKRSRLQKMKHVNTGAAQPVSFTREQADTFIFDVVMKELYENSDVNVLDLQKDILDKYKIRLSHKEYERIWEVLTTSLWISPSIGFGRAGKVELTTVGYQLLARYGSYSQYIIATEPRN